MDTSRIQEIILKVNGNDAEKTIKHIQGVIEKAKKAKEDLAKEDTSKWGDKEWKKWQQLNREIERGEKQLKKYGTNATYVKQVLDNLNGKSLNDLQASVKTMQRILDRGLVPRGKEDWNQLTEAIAKTKEQIEKVKNETNSFSESMDATKNKVTFFSSIYTGISYLGNILSSLSDKVAGYVSQYAAMQEHVAGVSKYTGMAAKDVEQLNEEFKKMDTKTSRAALNDLAADAGRLGITAKKDVLDFVQAADQINIALGEDLGEGAVKNIGKLANIFGDDQRLGLKQAMLSTASAINELAQNSSASEGNILDFTTRLSSMAKTAGLTQAQVMGLGAMFETQGLNAEVAATALAKVMQKMGTDTAKMAQLAGLNVQEFGNLVKTDMNAALIEFAKGIGRLGGLTEVSPVLKELSLTGSGVSSVVNILAQNLENVATQQDIATRDKSFGYPLISIVTAIYLSPRALFLPPHNCGVPSPQLRCIFPTTMVCLHRNCGEATERQIITPLCLEKTIFCLSFSRFFFAFHAPCIIFAPKNELYYMIIAVLRL